MLRVDANDSSARMRQKINANFGAMTVNGEPTGFTTGLDDDNMSIGVSYSPTTRKVTLSGDFEAYYKGTQIPVLQDGWVSAAHEITANVATMTNGVTNGNFTSSSNWSAVGGSFAVSSNIATITGDGTSSIPRISQGTSIATASGKKIYVRAMMRRTSATAPLSFLFRLFGSTVNGTIQSVGTVLAPVQNQWYTVSGVGTMPSDATGNVGIQPTAYYASAAAANGQTFQIKKVIAIDLTAVFGSGNEPTGAEMDAFMAAHYTDSWFDGTVDFPFSTFFLRYDGTQFLFDSTPWSFTDCMIAMVQCAADYRICLREVHGLTMSSADHKAWHNNYGTTRRVNGAIFSNIVTGSTTAANRRPYVNGVILQDEDLATDVVDLNTNSYTQRRLTGSSVTGTKSYTTAQTDIVKLNGNQPYYNQWTGSAWTDTLFPNNHYGAIFVVATPAADDSGSQPYRLLWVQPQQTSIDPEVIEALTTADLVHGESTSLLSEYTFIGKFIIQYTASNWVVTSYDSLLGNRQTQTSLQMVIDESKLVPTGAIMMWYTATAPSGWQLCDGSACLTAELTALIGANVPNMTTRVPVGKSSSGTFTTLGATGGHEGLQAHTHKVNPPVTNTGGQSVTHTHLVNSKETWAGSNTPMNWTTNSGRAAEAPTQYGTNTTNATGTNSADHYHGVDIAEFDSGSTGSGNAGNLQPYIVINYIIKT